MRSRLRALSALCVAVAACLVMHTAAAIGFVRNLLVGMVDVRPFRDLFAAPSLALEGPRGTPIGASLYQRNRHEAGLALLGAVRHT